MVSTQKPSLVSYVPLDVSQRAWTSLMPVCRFDSANPVQIIKKNDQLSSGKWRRILTQVFQRLSQWRVKYDEALLMEMLRPVSQTSINRGDTAIWSGVVPVSLSLATELTHFCLARLRGSLTSCGLITLQGKSQPISPYVMICCLCCSKESFPEDPSAELSH